MRASIVLSAAMLLAWQPAQATETLAMSCVGVVSERRIRVRDVIGGVETELPVRLYGIEVKSGMEALAKAALIAALTSHKSVVLWMPGERPISDEQGLTAIVLLGIPSVGVNVDDKIRHLPSLQEMLLTEGLASYDGSMKELNPELHDRWVIAQADAPKPERNSEDQRGTTK